MTRPASIGRRGFLAAAAAAPALNALPLRASPSSPGGFAESGVVQPAGPWTASDTIIRAGGSLAWRACGPENGEPVVLLHKLGGWLSDWRGVARSLGSTCRVIAFDLPGHGDSVMNGPPPKVQTVNETASMLLAALDELDVARASFAGNSLGGIVATQIAALWPERVARLTLASVSLFPGYSRGRLAQLESQRDPRVYDAEWRPVPRAAGGAGDFATMVPEVEIEQDASRKRADRWIRPSERGVGLFNMQQALARTIAPLQFIYGDRGHYIKYLETGKALRPDSEIVQLAETGSFVQQERPVEVADAMRRFLERDD